MKREEFLRVSPEAVGIESEGISKFIDACETGYTEMHAMIIMRHGKVCAEGWWAPWGPGVHQIGQSFTKTYMCAAIGMAIQDGLLSLDDRLIDIFPEYAPEEPSDYLKELTLYNCLIMGVGQHQFPSEEGNWVENFINNVIDDRPGTVYRYNSVASTFLGKIILKKTGMHVFDYLNEKLFKKIGIDYDNFAWGIAPEGKDMWAWRIVSTVEDNARLMKVFLDGGVVNGERLIPEDFIKLATSKRIDNATPENIRKQSDDLVAGYGFQMWMNSYPGSYRADGAAGQYGIVIPDKDMVIAIFQHAAHAETTLENIWKYIIPAIKSDEAIEENEKAYGDLKRKLSHLTIAAPDYAPYAAAKKTASGTYKVTEGNFNLYTEGLSHFRNTAPVRDVRFEFDVMEGSIVWNGTDNSVCRFEFAMDGTWRFNHHRSPWEFARFSYASGSWESDDCFKLQLLWPENDHRKNLWFTFCGDELTVTEKTVRPGMGEVVSITKAVRI